MRMSSKKRLKSEKDRTVSDFFDRLHRHPGFGYSDLQILLDLFAGVFFGQAQGQGELDAGRSPHIVRCARPMRGPRQTVLGQTARSSLRQRRTPGERRPTSRNPGWHTIRGSGILIYRYFLISSPASSSARLRVRVNLMPVSLDMASSFSSRAGALQLQSSPVTLYRPSTKMWVIS